MPAVKTVPIDGMGDFAFCIGQNDAALSNDLVTMLPNAAEYLPGTVLGQVTATGKFAPFAPAATDGTQTAVALLGNRAPISATDSRVVVVARKQPVNGNAIKFFNAVTAPQRAAAEASLATRMIMVRY